MTIIRITHRGILDLPNVVKGHLRCRCSSCSPRHTKADGTLRWRTGDSLQNYWPEHCGTRTDHRNYSSRRSLPSPEHRLRWSQPGGVRKKHRSEPYSMEGWTSVNHSSGTHDMRAVTVDNILVVGERAIADNLAVFAVVVIHRHRMHRIPPEAAGVLQPCGEERAEEGIEGWRRCQARSSLDFQWPHPSTKLCVSPESESETTCPWPFKPRSHNGFSCLFKGFY